MCVSNSYGRPLPPPPPPRATGIKFSAWRNMVIALRLLSRLPGLLPADSCMRKRIFRGCFSLPLYNTKGFLNDPCQLLPATAFSPNCRLPFCCDCRGNIKHSRIDFPFFFELISGRERTLDVIQMYILRSLLFGLDALFALLTGLAFFFVPSPIGDYIFVSLLLVGS